MLRAHYDQFGNIILGSIVRDVPTATFFEVPQEHDVEPKKQTWTLLEETRCEIQSISNPEAIRQEKPKHSVMMTARKEAKNILHKSVEESSKQMKLTVSDAKHTLEKTIHMLSDIPKHATETLKEFWQKAQTPVVLPGRKPGRRPRKKITLFLIDTVRFGGTFGVIFGVLFVGMNYQSFWQIARAELALGTDIEAEQALTNLTEGGSVAKTFQTIQSSGNINILAYLPPVGPHENHLIIPKLGINVPIVQPSMDALMAEDWPKFEKNIQEALRNGVVHYPGSARPGQAGNAFFTGHSSYYPTDNGRYKSIFARLGELELGDTYTVYHGGDRHTYRIMKIYKVKPNNVSVLDQPTDERLSTLMTCTPVGTTLERLIVKAEEIDPTTGQILKVGEKAADTPKNPFTRLEALPI